MKDTVNKITRWIKYRESIEEKGARDIIYERWLYTAYFEVSSFFYLSKPHTIQRISLTMVGFDFHFFKGGFSRTSLCNFYTSRRVCSMNGPFFFSLKETYRSKSRCRCGVQTSNKPCVLSWLIKEFYLSVYQTSDFICVVRSFWAVFLFCLHAEWAKLHLFLWELQDNLSTSTCPLLIIVRTWSQFVQHKMWRADKQIVI